MKTGKASGRARGCGGVEHVAAVVDWAFAAAMVAVALAAPRTVIAADLPVRIVTSIAPLAMLASQMGADRVVVHSILPPGADAHTFELRPSDVAAVAEADVVLMLGSSMDDWLDGAMSVGGNAIVVRLDEQVAHHGDEAHGAAHGAAHGEGDPHVWLDPIWVRDHALAAIQRALAKSDPAGAPRYGFASRAMAEDFTDLEEDVDAVFLRAPTRSFLAWHPAWEGFAKRFGLHSVTAVGESSGREPSLKVMIAAVRSARAAGVRAVLVEPQVDPRQAAVLADELGVPLVQVDPFGNLESLDRASYRTLMMFNADAFGRALGVEEEEDQEEDKDAPISAIPDSPDAP